MTNPRIWPDESIRRQILSVTESLKLRKGSMGGGTDSQMGKSRPWGIHYKEISKGEKRGERERKGI